MRPEVLSAAAAAILLSLVSLDSAFAEGRCSPGFHRNPYGRCSPNVVVAPAAPAVVAPPPFVCRGGFWWHPGFEHCVVI